MSVEMNEITVRDVCEALHRWFHESRNVSGPTGLSMWDSQMTWGDAVQEALARADASIGVRNKLKDVARWANGFLWRKIRFDEYDRTMSKKESGAVMPSNSRGKARG